MSNSAILLETRTPKRGNVPRQKAELNRQKNLAICLVWLESSMNIDHCILRSQYNIFGDEIVVTDDPHLHLVRYDNKIYIQPLPPCLTNHSFFEQYIIPS